MLLAVRGTLHLKIFILRVAGRSGFSELLWSMPHMLGFRVMRTCSRTGITFAVLATVFPLICPSGNPKQTEKECSRTSHLQVYSNAFYSKEAGDVVGYELALQHTNGDAIEGWLYIYQGEPNEDGVGCRTFLRRKIGDQRELDATHRRISFKKRSRRETARQNRRKT
jgi:hypothetical protein